MLTLLEHHCVTTSTTRISSCSGRERSLLDERKLFKSRKENYISSVDGISKQHIFESQLSSSCWSYSTKKCSSNYLSLTCIIIFIISVFFLLFSSDLFIYSKSYWKPISNNNNILLSYSRRSERNGIILVQGEVISNGLIFSRSTPDDDGDDDEGEDDDDDKTKCYGKSASSSSVCSGHGKCISKNNCSCDVGYYGNKCNNKYVCESLTQDSLRVCSGRGNCSANDLCDCENNYFGSNCELTTCYSIMSNTSSVCQGNGQCQSFNNCSCNSNRDGFDCGALLIDSENITLSITGSSVLDTQSNVTLVTLSFTDPNFESYYNQTNSLIITFTLQNDDYLYSENTTSLTWNLPLLTVGEYSVRVTIIDRNYDIIVGSSSITISVYALKKGIIDVDIGTIYQTASNLQNATNKTEVIETIANSLTNKTSNITTDESILLTKTLLIITDPAYTNYLTDSGKGAITKTVNDFADTLIKLHSAATLINSISTNLLMIASNLVELRLEIETMQKAIDSSLSAISISNKNEGRKEQVKVATKNFAALVVLDENGGKNTIDTSHSVSIPSSIGTVLGASITSFGIVKFESSPEQFNSGQSISFPAAKIMQFRTLVSGTYVPLNNLSENITLTFSIDEGVINETLINSTLISNSSAEIVKTYVCRYWNETEMKWLENGCITSYRNGMVTCYCDHTTRFSAFIDFSTAPYKKSDRSIQTSLSYASIAVSSIFLVVIGIVFTLLIILREKQPVKSRYITPHLALASLFIENLAIGVISKSILLHSAYFPNLRVDLMVSICTVISTSMRAAAIWCYMIMSLRYLVHRYFYEWMMKAIETDKKDSMIKYLNILKKQTVLVITSIITGVLFLIYFSIFVILRGDNSFTNAQFSTASTVSLFILLAIMTMIIIGIYITDLVLEKSNKQMSDEMVDIAEEMNSLVVDSSATTSSQQPLSKNTLSDELAKGGRLLGSIFKIFISNDALMFRTEVIFYLAGMLFFMVSYVIGFATLSLRFSDNTANNETVDMMDSVIFFFETLMTICLIIAFGGFAVVWAIKTEFNKRGWFTKKKADAFQGFDEKFEVLSLKQNKYLLKLFRQYTKTEMSLENYIIWIRLEKFKQDFSDLILPSNANINDWDKIVGEIDDIFKTHINSTSEMSVNINSVTRKKYLILHNTLLTTNITTLNENEVVELKTATNEVIMDLMTDIVYNLMDTYSRFVLTEEFKIVKQVQATRELITVQLFK